MCTRDLAHNVRKVIFWMFRDEVGRHIEVVDAAVGSIMRGEFYSRSLNFDLLAFIVANGRCARCARPIERSLAACACGASGHSVGSLDVLLTGAAADGFDQLLQAAMDQYRKAKRESMATPAEGELAEQEVQLLLDLQDSLCFYCASVFADGPNGAIFQRDHYAPVEYGGKSIVENTVLACPRCNASKGCMHGYDFELKMRRVRDPAAKVRYAAMRRRFRDYWRCVGKNHLAGKPSTGGR